MTGRIGKITAPPEVRRAKSGDTDVLMLTVRFSDGGAASVQWMPGAGDDSSPQEGDIVAVERFGGVLIATASKSPGGPTRKTGEREIYSRTPSGGKAARHILKQSGKQYIGNAVSGQDLYTLTNSLLTALSVFAAAAAGSQTDPVLVSAAAALQTALQPLPANLSGILEGRP
jgi:hypothetical protein